MDVRDSIGPQIQIQGGFYYGSTASGLTALISLMAGVMLQPEAEAGRTRPELADIFREYGEHYRHNHSLPLSHRRVMQPIEDCRTSALGGHMELCNLCGFKHPAYDSCRNRSASGGPIHG